MNIIEANSHKDNNLQKYSPRSSPSRTPSPAPSLDTSTADHSPESADTSVPFKILVTGKTVTVCLLSQQSSAALGGGAGFCPRPGLLAPVLVLSLFNPLCSVQSEDGWTRGEVSLFSMAVGHNKDLQPVRKCVHCVCMYVCVCMYMCSVHV